MWQVLAYTKRARGKEAAPPTTEQREGLSKIHSSDSCTELIEPLTGGLRHPFHDHSGCFLQKKSHIREINHYDTDYLLPVNGCGRKTDACATGAARLNCRAPGRNLLFDVGCSDYTPLKLVSGKVDTWKRGGYGSSLPLFQLLYTEDCITFDHMWGWEAQPKPNWWSTVPADVIPRLTFFNEPVNETNFFEVLKAAAQPDDFVVVKIDIDSVRWKTGPRDLEDRLMHRLSHDPTFYSLIDEIYFEYDLGLAASPIHVNDDSRWRQNVKGGRGDIRAAMRLMRTLRTHGVRSHFGV